MITIEHLPELTEAATRMLRRGGSPHIWDGIKQDIEDGRVKLFGVSNGSYLVLQIVKDELFIHACAGQHAVVLMQLCLQVAKCNSCTTVLFRTEKRGLLRLLKQFNPYPITPEIYKVST